LVEWVDPGEVEIEQMLNELGIWRSPEPETRVLVCDATT
jgi:hypothetical protein